MFSMLTFLTKIALLTNLFVGLSSTSFFGRTTNISKTAWSAAVKMTSANIADTLIECSATCQAFKQIHGCNGFQFDKSTKICQLANLTFLEDEQPNVENALFYFDMSFVGKIKMGCYGSTDCCRPYNQCNLFEGDCSSDDDCVGGGSVCGTKNCLTLGIANRVGGQWDSNDDCCERRCTPDHPCPQGDGHCETNADCIKPSWQSCVAKSCLNNSFFPLSTFSSNNADKYAADDNCCLRNCRPDAKCNHNTEGCETDDDCNAGYECLADGFCMDVDECAANGIGPSYCSQNAECVNTIGSFTCQCYAGYELHVPNVGCSDINECLQNPAPGCALRTACTNLDGSHSCECRPGYTGDPYAECLDIDECTLGGMYACTFGAKSGVADMACVNWPGSYKCVDSAIINGGLSYQWHMISARNKDNPTTSLTKCQNHGLPNMANNRFLPMTVYVNDYLIVCGGILRGVADLRDCQKLNLTTKVYEPMASMMRFRRHMTLNYVEDKIYALGGYRLNGGVSGNPVQATSETGTPCEKTMEEYDIEFNTWSWSPPLPESYGIHRHCAVSVDHRLFVLGGDKCSGSLDKAYIYDTRARSWTLLSGRRPISAYDLACAQVYFPDGKQAIVAAGGHTTDVGRRSNVHYLDLSNIDGNWVTMPSLPVLWGNMPHLAYLGKTLVMWSGYADNWGWVPTLVYVMDWSTNQWTRNANSRLGGNEEWNAFSVISSTHFPTLDCFNTQWSSCVATKVNNPGNDVSSTLTASLEDCADYCFSVPGCIVWARRESNGECFAKSAASPDTADQDITRGYMSNCFYHWLGNSTTQP